MTIRELQKTDLERINAIFALYWTDPEFIHELSSALDDYLENNTPDTKFFVSIEDEDITGIVGFRKLPDYLIPYTKTEHPIEFYIIAVKHQGRGTGEKLKLKLIEEIQNSGFTEILLYSPNSHQQSWPFHDKLGFQRIGEITPPDDDPGQLWQKIL